MRSVAAMLVAPALIASCAAAVPPSAAPRKAHPVAVAYPVPNGPSAPLPAFPDAARAVTPSSEAPAVSVVSSEAPAVSVETPPPKIASSPSPKGPSAQDPWIGKTAKQVLASRQMRPLVSAPDLIKYEERSGHGVDGYVLRESFVLEDGRVIRHYAERKRYCAYGDD